MTLRNNSLGLLSIVAVVAPIVSAGPATAQSKAEPVFEIRACVNYLQLSAAQRDIILSEEVRFTKLQSERALVINPTAPQSVPVTVEGKSEGPPARAPVEQANSQLAKLYDEAVGKAESELAADRRLLTMLEDEYRKCIKTPTQPAAKAEPTPAPKEVAKRKAARARATREREAPVRRGGDPGGSGGIGIIGGGGIGIGIGF
jgi:hypothetical protein